MAAQNVPQARMPEWKLVLLGNNGVGKAELIERLNGHVFDQYETKYVSTLDITVHSMVFYTNRGPLKFNLWDTAGREKVGELHKRLYAQAAGAIIMFDVTRRDTYTFDYLDWVEGLRSVCNDIPVVLVGNNPTDRVIAPKKYKEVLAYTRDRVPKYYDMSTSSTSYDFNLEKPFMWIARKLSGDDHLMFIGCERPVAAIRVEGEPPHDADLAAGR